METFHHLLLSLSLLHTLSPFILTSSLTLSSDSSALLSFKSAIAPGSIPPFSCLATWNFSVDPCQFTCGISCIQVQQNSRISTITLDPAGYSGRLSNSLSNLTFLSHLHLANNAFYGPIPASLFSLPSLKSLVISSNYLSGWIPSLVTNSSSLQKLDLSHNSLIGSIPLSLNSLSNLQTLDLSYNQLNGQMPDSFPPNLIELALRGNSINGSLKKSSFVPLKSIEVLELAQNQLEGKIEEWLLLLPSVQQVDLSNNTFTGLVVQSPQVSGTSQLVALDLGFNQIEGTIPVQLAMFESLTSVSLRYNKLKGAIPKEFYDAKKGVSFRRLFLDGNFLSGKVPGAFLQMKDFAGSFGDNCLKDCPVSMAVCSPAQKPDSVCKKNRTG
ncbi:hypothetical protein LUZ60_003006 [Juncus effusus]|nr:hypothetical protein LUZ60_003006 [Juncus effusus]